MQRPIAAAAVLVIAGMACAQQPEVFGSDVSFAFTWAEVDPVGAPNNILEPGEGARISLTVLMTPAGGSPITWNPAIGGSGTGELRAIQSFWFDLVGSGGAQGQWTDKYLDEVWGLGPPSLGTPTMGGASINGMQGFQGPASQDAVNLTNPIVDVWAGTWTPSSYAPRSVTFQSANGTGNPDPFASNVIVRDPLISNTVLLGTSNVTYGSVTIPIIPAPPAAAILGLGCLIASRRGR